MVRGGARTKSLSVPGKKNMTGKTISEKVLSAKSGCDARAGDIVICRVDGAMATDGSAPLAIDFFEQMCGTAVCNPEQIVFVMDHYPEFTSPGTDHVHGKMREFAARHGITLSEIGEGVGHQLMIESGRTRPGELLVGADSHSVTGGAMNTFATGIGSSDLAATMICGRLWFKVPETIKVILEGKHVSHLDGKDIALAIARDIGAHGAAYQALEYHGAGARDLDLDDRLVLCNMSVEMGAKAGIFPCDEKTTRYLAGRTLAPFHPVDPDADAGYSRVIRLDLSLLRPMIALPHAVENVVPVTEACGTPIHMAYLGTCTGGRVRDFRRALRILEAGGGIAPGVTLLICPASREVESELTGDGTIARLRSMGAVILEPGCGSCCGTAGPGPAGGQNVISTANRNFKGRMGNGGASIYLASPASCAAAAATGRITDPCELVGDGR